MVTKQELKGYHKAYQKGTTSHDAYNLKHFCINRLKYLAIDMALYNFDLPSMVTAKLVNKLMKNKILFPNKNKKYNRSWQ